jgi:glyoxylate reductase
VAGPRIFVTRAIPEASLARLAHALPGAQVDVWRDPQPPSRDQLLARARGADALLCTLADPIDRALLEALVPALRVVSTFAVGYENIDVAAARALGVRVAHTPGVLTDATAEVAVALLLACARRIAEGDRRVRAGRWPGWSPLDALGYSVHGKRVGIVGAGRIGRRTAEILRHGFRCELLVQSRSAHADWERELGARFVSKDELLAGADFVSLHCPLTPDTHHWIDAAALARMKPTACLINTTRGAVVDEPALVDALRAGRIAAAGLDVYEHEPRLAPGLAECENAVLLPHVGSATHETREAMGHLAVDAIVAVLRGGSPEHALA